MSRPPQYAPARPLFVRAARIVLPFAMSLAFFAYLFDRVDAGAVLAALSWRIALPFAGALAVFCAFTLAIEAQCLHRVLRAGGAHLDRVTAARIKAACYLLAILNYVFGAAGLTILLRRRAGLSLPEAASRVFLVSLFDLGAVLSIAVLSAAFIQVEALGVRMGLVAGLFLLILSGFLFLRIPTPIGFLERIRKLEVFVAPRTAPYPLLSELALLRFLFVASYVALAAVLFACFEIPVDPISLGLKVAILLVVSALPIAAAGLGTGQLVFVELFRGTAPEADLLAASLLFSIGLILARGLLGALFSLEFTREALEVQIHHEETAA